MEAGQGARRELGLEPCNWKGMMPLGKYLSTPGLPGCLCRPGSAQSAPVYLGTKASCPSLDIYPGRGSCCVLILGDGEENQHGWGSSQSPIIWNPLLYLQPALLPE